MSFSSPASEIPREAPATPTGVKLMSLNKQLLKVVWMPPADGDNSGGTTILQYKVEWDRRPTSETSQQQGTLMCLLT